MKKKTKTKNQTPIKKLECRQKLYKTEILGMGKDLTVISLISTLISKPKLDPNLDPDFY
jgi:hypothetical protein